MSTNLSNNLQETEQIAHTFLDQHLTSNLVGLVGNLGSGKTTFMQSIGKALQISGPITSPTFVIYKQYPIRFRQFRLLVHADVYRINNWDELIATTLPELWLEPQNLLFIEWADRFRDHLPPLTQYISFQQVSENQREIKIS